MAAPSVAVQPASSICVAPPALPATPVRRESLCWTRGRPKIEPVEAPGERSCSSLDMLEVDRVEREVRRQIKVQKPNKLVVDFGCKTASEDLTEVWFEDGSGHGFSLQLTRLVRRDDQVSVRRLSGSHGGDRASVEVSEGQLAWSKLGPIVERAHIAMLAHAHELSLFDPRSMSFPGISSSFSSNDFHLRLSIVDRSHHVDDRGFTGYESSDELVDIVPMRMATDALGKAIEGTRLTPTALTDEDRAFFRRRMQATLAGNPSWWVHERYIEQAAKVGTIDLVPLLVAETQRKGSDVGDVRRRNSAIDAIATITGWDPRRTDDGQPRPIDEVVALVATECAL